MIDSSKVRLAYYDAPDGPRIMLFGPMEMDLVSLKTCFLRLAKGEPEIDLGRQSFIYTASAQLRLRSVGKMFKARTGNVHQGLRRQEPNAPRFSWNRSSEGWEYLAELIDGLIRSRQPGHQYLTRYPDEDAIVVVSKGEYGDDVLKG